MAAPTYDYFGSNPVTIVFKTSSNFDGANLLPGVIGDIKPGVITFPIQVGGGSLNFHTRPLLIQNIMAKTFPLTASLLFEDGTQVVIAELTTTKKSISETFVLPTNASLKLVGSGGAGEAVITAMEYIPGNTL